MTFCGPPETATHCVPWWGMSLATVTQQPVNETVRGRPGRVLAPYIRSYTGYRYGGLAPGFHQGVPSGSVTFIVSLDEPVDLVTMPGDQSPLEIDALVGGLHLRPATIAHHGSGAGVSVDLSPLGSRALFGLPAAPLASLVVDLRDLLGRAGDELVDRLRAAPSWPARFAVLDEVLGRAVDQPRRRAPVPREVVHAWQLLTASGGRITIADLAAEVGWSRRHLASRFAAELGVSPKSAARVLRFERTGALLDRGLGLADAAVAGGYYDQAHMTTEWRELCGSTPARWHDDEVRDRHHDDEPLIA
jgi:AraC-like DNA-binding protein